MFFLLAALTMVVELAVGYPQALVRAIGHPVVWIGAGIDWLDRTFNRMGDRERRRRLAGVGALLAIVAVPAGLAYLIVWFAGPSTAALLAIAVLGSSLIAQRSLAAHVSAVASALEKRGLEDGRKAVSMIVGRDPERLDEAAVCRAAIESLAENFSDGVVAPVFWLCVGGLPGLAAYKSVNTADSMIGHKTEKHGAFGWAAARFDDLVNLPASRLTALMLVVAASMVPGSDWRAAARAVWRDAPKHRSPNAGWPEAAMAGALGLALAGPRHYGGVLVDDAEMGGGGRREAMPADIHRALRLYWTADLLLLALIGSVAAASMMHG